jgi:hypothetical protein
LIRQQRRDAFAHLPVLLSPESRTAATTNETVTACETRAGWHVQGLPGPYRGFGHHIAFLPSSPMLS